MTPTAWLRMHLRYASYVARHKAFVFRACLRLGVPWLGVLHDASKLRPDEWVAYARYFYGGRFPDGSWGGKLYVPGDVADGFERAWLLHLHRNKHHPQFWALQNDTDGLVLLEMPQRYVREMVADWVGAGMAIRGHGWAQAPGETLAWWHEHKGASGYRMHPRTASTVVALLETLR